jgi:hypothetical protein
MRTWKCKHCGRKADVGYEDILEIGTPICCDDDMTMLPTRKADALRLIVEVQGGCVQAVYATDPKAAVDLLDWDNMKDGDATPAERREARKLELKAKKMAQVF